MSATTTISFGVVGKFRGLIVRTLPVHAETVLITRAVSNLYADNTSGIEYNLPEDSNCVQRQLVSL